MLRKVIFILVCLIFFTSIYNVIIYLTPKKEWRMLYPPNVAKDPEGGKITYFLSNNLNGILKLREDGAVFINNKIPIERSKLTDVYLIFCDPQHNCDSIRLIRIK